MLGNSIIQIKKEPGILFRRCRANTWRRPTLTGPIVPLPLALRRFTSGFGMGPGGSTALWSPEGNIGSRAFALDSKLNLWRPELLLIDYCLSDIEFNNQYPILNIQSGARTLTSTRRVIKVVSSSLQDLRSLQGHSRSLVISNSKNRNQAERMISTGQLHTLPHFHFQPINVVVFDDPSGKTHLGRSLALRCFQRLSLPNLATRPCR